MTVLLLALEVANTRVRMVVQEIVKVHVETIARVLVLAVVKAHAGLVVRGLITIMAIKKYG